MGLRFGGARIRKRVRVLESVPACLCVFRRARSVVCRIQALDLDPGGHIIVPGFTCVVVPNAVKFAGHAVKFCDIELNTYGLDVACLRSLVSAETRAIVMHHLFGLVSRDYSDIVKLAEEANIPLIEDCAHSAGAKYRHKRIGNRGKFGFFSSEQSKSFCTIQGGVIVTNDDDLASRVSDIWNTSPVQSDEYVDKLLANIVLGYYANKHPRRRIFADLVDAWLGDIDLVATTAEELAGVRPNLYGARMSPPIARIAFNQLSKLERYNQIRRTEAKRWERWCARNAVAPPTVIAESEPVFLRYPVLVEPHMKQHDAWARQELGVKLGHWFVGNLHPLRGKLPECPNANYAVDRCVNFPCIPVS